MVHLPLPDQLDRTLRRDARDGYYAPIRGAVHPAPRHRSRALITRAALGWMLVLAITASVFLAVRFADMIQPLIAR